MKKEKMQFSKFIIIMALLFAIVGCILSIFIEMDSSIAIAIISVCGAILTTTIIFYLKKAQSENTLKIYMGTYKEILKLKKKYGDLENCDKTIEQMEENIEGKIDSIMNSAIEDATSTIELNVPNVM